MGQKTNPIGLRLGLHRKWKSNWFLESTHYTDFLHLNYEINKYFAGILRNSPTKTFFSHCVIAKYSLENIYLFVFFYRLRRRKKRTQFIKFFIRKKKIEAPISNDYIKLYNLMSLIPNSVEKKITIINDKPLVLKNKISKENSQNSKFKLKRGTYVSTQKIRNSLSNFTKKNISLTFINLLSFIRFYLYLNNEKRLLSHLENQMMNFYRYEVKLVRDAVNIVFISLVLKQPQTLARFIGYQLRRTPKNRRQTKLIQFYKKITTLIVQKQTEIYGLRIKFKGRLNGRKRAKTMYINIGRLPLQTHSCAIEYGQSEGLTIYGTVGVKVWIFYDKSFNKVLQEYFIKYFYYKNKES